MEKLKLRTSLTHLQDIHSRVNPDGKGKKPKKVTLERGELMDLLMDHSTLVGKLEEFGVRTS